MESVQRRVETGEREMDGIVGDLVRCTSPYSIWGKLCGRRRGAVRCFIFVHPHVYTHTCSPVALACSLFASPFK